MNYRVGIDVGGTFTDLALHDVEANTLQVGKVLSTAPDPSEGVRAGFLALLEAADANPAYIIYLAHASTVASNLVIERNGDRTALVTTRGFRDVLHLQRQKRAELYDLFYDKPEPLVARRDIFEVTERMLADGTVHEPLSEDEVEAVLTEAADRGITSIGVALLHAYANPEHERRVATIASRVVPDMYVSLSSEIAPKWREYERSSTTVVNAYVLPPVSRYLSRMESFFAESGVAPALHVMQCSGGIVVSEAIKRLPVSLIESGPAAGALMGGVVGRLAGCERVIAFDMGGTTAKVSIVENGEPHIDEDFEIAPVTKLRPGSGLPVSVPAVDLIEIGTGGGSIAHVQTGVLAVGPQSAGASPGPACYGNGGAAPTVTDANVVLGYLDPDYFLGGELKLDVEAARHAIDSEIGGPLGLSAEEAAFAIHTVANAQMASAMRIVSIQKGLDPRDFAVVAFGGAGPSHVASIANELGVERIIVPANAGIASALGLLVARIRCEFSRTLIRRLDSDAVDEVARIFAELEDRGRVALSESNALEGSTMVRYVRMRYVGQGYEIGVTVPSGPLTSQVLESVRASFLDTYRALYGYADPDEPIEIVDWRLSALGPDSEGRIPENSQTSDAGSASRQSRRAYFKEVGGFVEASVWSRYELAPGVKVEGPAVIQERESTTLVPPGVSGAVDEARNLVLTIGTGGRR